MTVVPIDIKKLKLGLLMKPINVAVIGCGYWGPNLIRNFNQIADCNMKVCCDLCDEKLTRMRNLFPTIETTKCLEEILENPLIDAVVVATPVYTHLEIGKKCLEHNKHIMIEKPLASSEEECIELINLAEKYGQSSKAREFSDRIELLQTRINQ